MPSIEHKILPHCWVCEVRFNDQHPPGPAVEERHHLMPQAYGGTDGPQVSLCDTHHTKLHKVASALKAGRPYLGIMTGESPQRQKKLLWMAILVVKADRATVNDENKMAKVVLVLDRHHQQLLDFCKARLGKTNRSDVLKEALVRLASALNNTHP